MADVIISPNMNLPVPIVGQDPGPDWANNTNACWGIVDQHNHIAGSGNLVPVAGLDINADFPLNGNNIVTVKTVNFQAQVSPLAGLPPNLGAIYVAGSELYYNDEVGNVVQITNSGSVNSGAGSITGLPSGTASASFSSATFIWQSATNTAADLDFASAILRNTTPGSFGLTLNPPNAMAADYSLTLPNLPGSTLLVTLDTSGNFGTVANSSIADTLGQAMTSTGANAVANTRTRTVSTTVGVGGVAISNSSGNFSTTSTTAVDVTNLSVTITTSGRPVAISLIPDGTASTSQLRASNTSSIAPSIHVLILNGATQIADFVIGIDVNPVGTFRAVDVPVSSVSCSDAPAAGTYTYKVQMYSVVGTTTGSIVSSSLRVYEL